MQTGQNNLKTDDIFNMRLAGYGDVDGISALMNDVYAYIDDKETFICDDIEFVRRHIENEGFILIAENRTLCALSGVFIVRYPKNSDDNLGKHINLSVKDLMRVAHMESTVVAHCARGHHLEEKMIKCAESIIDDNYDILMSMASPKNIASMKAFTRSGFEIAKENIDYNGYLRNVFIKYRDK